jgi:hypothetical protein
LPGVNAWYGKLLELCQAAISKIEWFPRDKFFVAFQGIWVQIQSQEGRFALIREILKK